MWKLLVLLSLVAVEGRPRHASFEARSDVPFIVGGQAIGKGRWPWQLSLQICGFLGCSHTCGAVLLGARKALTAAHCTRGRSGFEVVGGVSNIGGPPDGDYEEMSRVASATEHPDYGRPGAQGNPADVATLVLAGHISDSSANITYATLSSTSDSSTGANCFISGWGKTLGTNVGGVEQLREANVDSISTAQCRQRMPPNLSDGIGDSHVCVHSDSRTRGSCQGDSGGPLNCEIGGTWKVAGVTSWGVGIRGGSTCLTDYPSVYANVAKYRTWIDAN